MGFLRTFLDVFSSSDMVLYNYRKTNRRLRYLKDTNHRMEDDVMEKEEIIKLVVLGLVIAYIVSPIDLMPGPIDDVIVLLMGAAVNRHRIEGGG